MKFEKDKNIFCVAEEFVLFFKESTFKMIKEMEIEKKQVFNEKWNVTIRLNENIESNLCYAPEQIKELENMISNRLKKLFIVERNNACS